MSDLAQTHISQTRLCCMSETMMQMDVSFAGIDEWIEPISPVPPPLPDPRLRYWTLAQAYYIVRTGLAYLFQGIKQGHIHIVQSVQGKLLIDADSVRQWNYSSHPPRNLRDKLNPSLGKLLKTARELQLMFELYDVSLKAYGYAQEIDFDLPADWIGRLVAEIHSRERRQRLAIFRSFQLGSFDELE